MRRAPGINAIAGCRVEKALIINNYGKPAARFSPCVGVDDRRMGCIRRDGSIEAMTVPILPSVPRPFAYAYDTGLCPCVCVFCILLFVKTNK